MSVFTLIALVLINGQPSELTQIYKDPASCEAAKAELTADLIKKFGDFKGGIVCTEVKIADKHA